MMFGAGMSAFRPLAEGSSKDEADPQFMLETAESGRRNHGDDACCTGLASEGAV